MVQGLCVSPFFNQFTCLLIPTPKCIYPSSAHFLNRKSLYLRCACSPLRRNCISSHLLALHSYSIPNASPSETITFIAFALC